MGSSVRLVILLLLSSILTIEGKAISKRYVEHLLREGYTSDCGESAHIEPTSLPAIIAARAAYSPISYAEPTPLSYEEPHPMLYAESGPISYEEPHPISYAEPAPISYEEPDPVTYAEPAPISYEEEPSAITYAEPTPIPCAEPTPIPCAEPTAILCAEPTAISYAEPTPISYAEPIKIIAEHKPSAAFGYEFTVPIPPTPQRLIGGKPDDCETTAPIQMLPSPAPVEIPAPATTITTTDCHGIPTLPPLAPPPVELPLPSPEELPPTHHHEGATLITDPSKTGDDLGVEVAAAPLFDELPPAPQLLEGPALTPQYEEGCHGTTTYAAPYLYGTPQLDLTHPSQHQWEQEEEFGTQGKASFASTDFAYGGGKSLPLLLKGYEEKAFAGFRYGMPTLKMSMPTHWNLTPKMTILKRKPLLIRTGISHPLLSTGFEGYQGKIITPQHNLIHLKSEWHLPMYRTGVSHPFLSAKAK